MRKQCEINLNGLGRMAKLPNVEASLGRQVRFLKPCPLNVRAVYTLSLNPHHSIPEGALAYLVAIHPNDTVTLHVPYRKRQVTVPVHYLELMPKPLVDLGELTPENVSLAAQVELNRPIGVTGRRICVDALADSVQHVLKPGRRGVVTAHNGTYASVLFKGHHSATHGIEYYHLNLLGESPE